MPATLSSQTHGQTLVLTWSNPELRNAMGPDIYAAAMEALNAVECNTDIRSVVLTGAGQTFSAGGNLQRLQHNRSHEPAAQQASINALHGWIDTLRTFPKPVIAAVEGSAAGAGFSVALACDFIVAARDAQFIMSYSRVGLSPDGGASFHLPLAMPRQFATELLMLGERVGTERLHQMGVVNRISESGEALACALQLAEQLNAQAPNVLASTKELLAQAPQATLAQQLNAESEHFMRNLRDGNAEEGITAFLAKRKPTYR